MIKLWHVAVYFKAIVHHTKQCNLNSVPISLFATRRRDRFISLLILIFVLSKNEVPSTGAGNDIRQHFGFKVHEKRIVLNKNLGFFVKSANVLSVIVEMFKYVKQFGSIL